MTLRIGVLTSGGDAPGMNAAIAGVCETVEQAGAEAVGFARGYRGLCTGEHITLTPSHAHRHLHNAGTWLESSRYPELHTQDGRDRACRGLRAADVEGLAVIGGDGSLQGARALANAGVRVAFIPATIDNDIAGTETAIGIDSAVNYAVVVIHQLRITGRSLRGRAFIVETLGAQSQQLALAVAAAAAVENILLTGQPVELERVADNLRRQAEHGDAIAVMPEGIGNAVEIAARLERHAGVRVHPSILGHAQRAAPPTSKDLAIALSAGRAAAGLLLEGRSGFIALQADGPSVTDLLAT